MNDDLIICRCEEITYGEVLAAIKAGCHSITTIKKYTRSGMGSCQGRICAPLIIKILRSQNIEVEVEDKPNFPYLPIRIGDMEVGNDE